MPRLVSASFLLLCWLVALAGCTQQDNNVEIKLAHGLNTTHPVHIAMEMLAKDLHAKSGGSMTITLYPNQQLGSERQVLELLQIGSVGMSKVSAAVLENFAPGVEVLNLPYIFTSQAHYYGVLDSQIGKDLLNESLPVWLKGLAFYDAGSRNFYTVEAPVLSPDDLAGQKIRVQPSITAMNMIREMGGSPTPIAWGELYTALQQGVVDGAENNLPSYYSSRHYEVAPFFSFNAHTRVPDVLMISTHLWSRLTPQQQQWLQDSVDYSVVEQRRLWQKMELQVMNIMEEQGVSFHYPKIQDFKASVDHIVESDAIEPLTASYISRIVEFDGQPKTKTD